MTVLEVIQKSAAFLEKKGVDSPRLQSELMLAELLKKPRLKLYLDFADPVAEPVVDQMREWVKRRGQREPLQHILGKAAFCDFELIVNRHTLIPRPETEILAEHAGQFLAGLPPPARAWDFGTGTGCLAIALARKCPAAAIVATDCSAEALAVARQNAVNNGVAERIRFAHGDGLAALAADDAFDLIVSNPPYIPSGEIAGLPPEVRDFDPRAALDGGADGLDFYRLLAAQAAARLRPGGRMMLELGDGQAEAVAAIFSTQKWVVLGVERDYSKTERFIVLQS